MNHLIIKLPTYLIRSQSVFTSIMRMIVILTKVEFDTDDNVNHLIMKLPTYVIESQCQNSAAPPRPGTEELICGDSIFFGSSFRFCCIVDQLEALMEDFE